MSDNEEPMIKTPADFGQFLLEKELGHGGMGGVYLAHDKMLDRRVGIKVMLKSLGADPKFVERFQREAQAAARLNHPNIAQIYSFGQEQGMPYIAMELVSGGSLDKEMEEHPGSLGIVHVMRVGQQVADALALAAESGLVHGDVKPENVLFDTDGNAKLVDFGLAAMQGDSDEIWGTPYYISPEKVRRQKIDYRADIYSLGGTLYHALTGVPPFDGPDPTAVVKARFDGPPKKPSEIRPDIPPEVDELIMRMLELEPSMRHPTYQSLLGDFKRYLSKAGPVKRSGKAGGPKLKFKGLKPKATSVSTGGIAPVADGDIADLPSGVNLTAVEEKKRMSVGAIVGMAVVGVILLVVLVVGGLFWYVHSEKEAKAKRELAELVDKQAQARSSIDNTVAKVKERYAEFHKRVQENGKMVEQAAQDVRKALPAELKAEAAAVFAMAPTKDVAAAIAYTNKLFAAQSVAPAAPQAAGTATNAPPANAMVAAQGMQAMMGAVLGSGKPASPAQIEKLAKKILASAKDPNGESLDSASPEYKEALDKLKASPEFAMFAQIAAVNPAAVDAVTKALGDSANIEKAMQEMSGKLGAKGDAKKPKEEKPAEEKPVSENAADEKPDLAKSLPPMTLPMTVKSFTKIWEDMCQCRAADIKFHGRMTEILVLAEKAKGMTAQDGETTTGIINLSNDLVERFNKLNVEKWLTDAMRKSHDLARRCRTYTDDAVRKLKQIVEKRERQLAELRAKEEKAAAEAAAAEKHKQDIADERQKAIDEFEPVVRDAKRLDWERCKKQLTRLQEGMKTFEGKEAVTFQLHKIECMEGMQKHFIKHGAGFKFKSRPAMITKVDDKSFMLQKFKMVKGKSTPEKETRVEWWRFYGLKEKEFLFYMNDLINELVMKGRERKKVSSPLEWSEHMLGAALTLQYFYSEEKGVDKFIPVLVKKAVKEFEPCRKWAKNWFPNVELEEAE